MRTFKEVYALTLTGNDNKTPLSQRVLESGLSAGKTHNIILPVWKTNTEKFTYTVYEYRPDTKYGVTFMRYPVLCCFNLENEKTGGLNLLPVCYFDLVYRSCQINTKIQKCPTGV